MLIIPCRLTCWRCMESDLYLIHRLALGTFACIESNAMSR
jgi:hypothetical protein